MSAITSTRNGQISRRATRNRRRRIARLEMVALILITSLIVFGVWLTSGDVQPKVRSSAVRVEAGETLWTLAKAHPVEGLSTEQNTQLIARLNGMDSHTQVAAGTVLRVPAAPADPDMLAVAMR